MLGDERLMDCAALRGVGVSTRLTDRDLEYLALVCRFPFVTAPQIQAWVHGKREPALLSPLYRRLRGLEARELVTSDRVLESAPKFISATREGMQAVGVTGKVQTAKHSQFRHDLTLVDLALNVLHKRPEFTLVTEREMRSEDTSNQHHRVDRPEWATVRPAGDPMRRRLFPDLIQVAPSGRRVVHELEMTPKDVRRLSQIMRAYVLDERVAVVRYWTAPAAHARVEDVAGRVNEWAQAEGVGPRVTVEAWTSPEEGQ